MSTCSLDGAQLFPYLWRYFLRHPPISQWLMRSGPQSTSIVSPSHVAQGIGFCCNFTVPQHWSDMTPSFDLGEMFIPHHYYQNFMCGTVVAATSYHKHLVCALGKAAVRDPQSLPSYRTTVRRMVIDTSSSRSINIVEFSWMEDSTLIVTAKVLVPPDPNRSFQPAGCSGAFALFSNIQPGQLPPEIPQSLVSFVEAPRCRFCTQSGAVSCCCTNAMIKDYTQTEDPYTTAVWPPRIDYNLKKPSIDAYYNIRNVLNLITHISHVKVTAHVVLRHTEKRPDGRIINTYKLGPSRFVIKAVSFRRSNPFESDTLRQVADKLRLLRSASIRVANAISAKKQQQAKQNNLIDSQDLINFPQLDINNHSLYNTAGVSTPSSQRSTVHSPNSSESSFLSSPCVSCGRYLVTDHSTKCSQCQVVRKRKTQFFQPNNSYYQPTNVRTGDTMLVRIPCPRCDKTFSQQGSLNRHLKNIHEERKIPCQFCNMSFGQMFDLKVSTQYLQFVIYFTVEIIIRY